MMSFEQSLDLQKIEWAFTEHPFDDIQRIKIGEIRAAFRELACGMSMLCPSNEERDQAMQLTNQAMRMFFASIEMEL